MKGISNKEEEEKDEADEEEEEKKKEIWVLVRVRGKWRYIIVMIG